MKLDGEKTALGTLELAFGWRRQKKTAYVIWWVGVLLATTALSPSRGGRGVATPDYILITSSLRSLLFSLGKSVLRGNL